MSEQQKLRFKIKRADGSEIELEGDLDYVKQKYEELMSQLPPPIPDKTTAQNRTNMSTTSIEELTGLVEKSPDDKIHFLFNADLVSAKEAIALMAYAHYPRPLTYIELSDMLSSGWKTTKSHVVRARASELKKEGRLIVESGRYSLSGAGVQWVRNEIAPRIKTQTQ